MRQPRFGRNVGERAVAVVVEQVTGGMRIAHLRVEAGPVDQEDIQPAVVVVVEERRAAAHFLEDELLVVRTARDVEGPRQTGGRRDVGKHNRRLSVARKTPVDARPRE